MSAESAKGQAVRRGMTLTFAKVVEQHREWDEPLILWRDGKVVHEYVDQALEVAEEPGEYHSRKPSDTSME